MRTRRVRFADKAFGYVVSGLVVLTVVAAVFFGAVGCPGDADQAHRIVEDAGYTNITIGGAKPWRCGRDDARSNSFEAIAPSGRHVEGVVCCSMTGCMKGCTMRFE